MELVDYLKLLRRRAIYILVALVAGLVGGYSVAHKATETYSSTIRLYVSTASPDTSGLIDSLSQVASSAGVISQASAKSAGAGPLSVTAHGDGSSSVLDVVVTSTDPQRASGTAAAYSSILPNAFAHFDPFTQLTLQVLDQSGAEPAPLHKSRTLAIGGVLGLVVGFAAALLREALDRTVPDPHAMAERLELPLQGVVPADRVSKGIVTRDSPRSARAEAYRRLSASLRLAPGEGGRIGTLAVTSAVAGEGKTTTALNLAEAAADAGERVLVLDADLRRPAVGSVLGVPNSPGLSDVLGGSATLHDVITVQGRFHSVLAGSPVKSPVDLLRSAGFADLLHRLRSDYDLVVVDTPAALGVADAEVLGAACDAVLFVSRVGGTERGRVDAAVAAMRRGGSRMWGLVGTFASASEPLPKPLNDDAAVVDRPAAPVPKENPAGERRAADRRRSPRPSDNPQHAVLAPLPPRSLGTGAISVMPTERPPGPADPQAPDERATEGAGHPSPAADRGPHGSVRGAPAEPSRPDGGFVEDEDQDLFWPSAPMSDGGDDYPFPPS